MRGKHGSRGYTLIEVLVAFMILALSLTVLLRIFSGGLRNIAVSSDYSRAALIAESQLAAAAVGRQLSPGVAHGSVDDTFHWTRSIREYTPFPKYSPAATATQAYYVTVTVEWPHGDRTRSVDLATVHLAHEGGLQQ